LTQENIIQLKLFAGETRDIIGNNVKFHLTRNVEVFKVKNKNSQKQFFQN